MLKIADLNVGDSCSITLVVKSATPRETRAKKPYLQLEFYDGVSSINANYWDWASGNVPPVNSILDITGQVTEWQGAKQLTVKSLKTNNTLTLASFTPASSHDLSQIYKDAYELITNEVTDDELRDLTLALLDELRPMWLEVPGAISMHHNYVGGTLVHSYDVACYAKAIADITPEANKDLCIVGGLLHDLGKLFAYKLDGIAITMTYEGQLYEHSFIGAEFIGNFADSHLNMENASTIYKVGLLRHIILSHHGKLEFGAVTQPQCIEAMIVNAADGLSAAIEQVRSAAAKAPERTWTDKIYALGNRTMLTPDYISKAMHADYYAE